MKRFNIKKIVITILLSSIIIYLIICVVTLFTYGRYTITKNIDASFVPYLEKEFDFTYSDKVSIDEVFYSWQKVDFGVILKLSDEDFHYYITKTLKENCTVEQTDEIMSNTTMLKPKGEISFVGHLVSGTDDMRKHIYEDHNDYYIIVRKYKLSDKKAFYKIFDT